jgi:plastocyanin
MFRQARLVAVIALVLSALALASVALASPTGVKVKDNYFNPKSLTIERGTRVTWTWYGVKYHNVTVKSGPVMFGSRTQVRGTFSWTFKKRGVYHLFCTIHHSMKMTIVVR